MTGLSINLVNPIIKKFYSDFGATQCYYHIVESGLTGAVDFRETAPF